MGNALKTFDLAGFQLRNYQFWQLLDLLALFPFFHLFQRPGPVFAQQAAEGAVGKQLSPGLATDTIVGLVGGIANALYPFSAARAGLTITSMDGHAVAEGGYFLRKFFSGFETQTAGPLVQRVTRGLVEAGDFFAGQPPGQFYRGELRLEKNLIGVCVTDTAEQPGIGERALQRVVLGSQHGFESI